MTRWRPAVLILFVSAIAACAPAAPAAGPASNADGLSGTALESRTLIFAIPDEPATVAAKPLRSVAGQSFTQTRSLFNAGLAVVDQRGVSQPQVAEALPQLRSDSWRVLPDGRMETTYRLRSNLTWHDGTPLDAEDFAFAFRVYTTPELGSSGSFPQRLMEEVAAPDPRTVLIRWRQPYPDAGSLKAEAFQALPRHLLEGPFQQAEAEAFVVHQFWSQEFVGLGPYRLDRWEPGAFIEGSAFSGYALGRPKIERIRLVPIRDHNVILASLLAESAHISIESELTLPDMRVLQQQWAGRDGGSVLLSLAGVRYTQVQFRPELANPPAILDARVRRALAHAIDKQALNDGLLEGLSQGADSFISPQLDYFAAVDAAVSKYPYDLRRMEQVMAEAGFVKGREGFYGSPTEGPFAPELLVSGSGQNEQEASIMVDTWRQAGVDARLRILSQAQSQDPQPRASFPTMNTNSATADPAGAFGNLSTSQSPRPENRWTGSNRGGFSNPDYDRLYDAYSTSLDAAERSQYLVQGMKFATEEVAVLFLYYKINGLAHVAALKGPQAVAPIASDTWNVHEWEWRS